MHILKLNPDNGALLITNSTTLRQNDYPEFSDTLQTGTKRECMDKAQEWWAENYVPEDCQLILNA